MQYDKRTDETTPAATEKPTPNGNIGVGSAGDDVGGQVPIPAMPDIGRGKSDTTDEPGQVGREESGTKDESRTGFTGDEPHLPGQPGSPDDTDAGTHYLPEGEDAH